MEADAWADFHRRWAALTPPLRPHPDVVAAIAAAVAGADRRVLLLGATPELCAIGDRLVAIDWSAGAIAHIWPGSDRRRRIVRADWRALPLATASMDAAVSDGALGVMRSGEHAALFAELARVVRPGGRVALRCYLSPDRAETAGAVRDAAMAGAIGNFHAFKWRLAMALAAEAGTADMAMAAVHTRFEALFPARDRLATASGWSRATIDEIDAYAGSDGWLCFPTASRLLREVPSAFAAEFAAVGGYPLAERCPLLVMQRR